MIKETVERELKVTKADFTKHVLLVLTVPAEYSEKAKAIMRDCVHKADLIESKNSEKLQFTTERKCLLPLRDDVPSNLKDCN